MQATELLKQYSKPYAEDDDNIAEFLVGQYAGKWNELTALQIHLRGSLNADDTLSADDRKDRDGPLSPKTNAGIMTAIHGLMISDSKFVQLGKHEVRVPRDDVWGGAEGVPRQLGVRVGHSRKSFGDEVEVV